MLIARGHTRPFVGRGRGVLPQHDSRIINTGVIQDRLLGYIGLGGSISKGLPNFSTSEVDLHVL